MRPALLLALVLAACTHAREFGWPRAPVSLNDALRLFDRRLTDTKIAEIRDTPLREFVALAHLGIGTNIRNGWGLWSGKPLIARSLRRRGFVHPEDQSHVILTSLWLHLHGLPLRLDEQLAYDRDYERAAAAFEREAAARPTTGPFCVELSPNPLDIPPRRELQCFERYYNCTRYWTLAPGTTPTSAFSESDRAECDRELPT